MMMMTRVMTNDGDKKRRELTQQDGWNTQDGRMTKKMSCKIENAQSRATFFHH